MPVDPATAQGFTECPGTFITRSSEQPSYNELISLQEAAKLSGLSASHLRLLVSRGDIWGVKLGRNWVTTASRAAFIDDSRPIHHVWE